MAPRSNSSRSQCLRQRPCSNRGRANRRASGFASADATSSSRLLALPVDLLLAICHHIPLNDIACSVRLTCTAFRDALNAPEHRIVRLSEPVQPAAFEWGLQNGFPCGDRNAVEARKRARSTSLLDGLTFEEKILLSELTAGTGILPNLVALHRNAGCPGHCGTPRAAAVGSHLHVLQWLEAEGSCLGCLRVQQAVGAGTSLTVLQWYIDREDAHLPTLFGAACEDDDPDRRQAKLQYMVDRYGKDAVLSCRATSTAARRGDIKTLAWLKDLGADIDTLTFVAAAGGGDVAAVMWVTANLTSGDAATSLAAVHQAAIEGRVEMLQWLKERLVRPMTPAQWHWVLAMAAAGGHVAAVRWLVQQVDPDLEALEAAAEGGHCEVMLILLSRGVRPSPIALEAAAKSGSVAAMQILLDKAAGAPTSTSASGDGVSSGAETGAATAAAAIPAEGAGGRGPGEAAAAAAAAILRPQAYRAAAFSGCCSCGGGSEAVAVAGSSSGGGGSSGSLVPSPDRGRDCLAPLQWLEQHGCPAGGEVDREEAMGAAALMGSRARVEWLRARGFRWTAQTFAAAAASGCIRLVEWMAAQGCPMGRRGDALLAAGANSDTAMLAALRRLGCPWSADVLPRAVQGELYLGSLAGSGGADGAGGAGTRLLIRCRQEVMRWMVAHGCPVTSQAYKVALQCGRNDVADWLRRSGKLH
ncbi:hypothetical protein VaNZ11_006245 [Volvox africanus]|uniref:F-box domain-containing protein n=1 Tax=Volvox africanus TaxID=51714 RepID=A0ABQ5S1J7_9CHLO|nr:hypothetical protein VaNZ11_006245 [Volvox africanus]